AIATEDDVVCTTAGDDVISVVAVQRDRDAHPVGRDRVVTVEPVDDELAGRAEGADQGAVDVGLDLPRLVRREQPDDVIPRGTADDGVAHSLDRYRDRRRALDAEGVPTAAAIDRRRFQSRG